MKNVAILCGLWILLASMAAYGQIKVAGATNEETEMFNRAFDWRCLINVEAGIKACDSILKEHPDNRPARSMRIELMIQAGRPADAKLDIDWFQKNSPGFGNYATLDDQAELARCLGDRQGLIAAYKSLAKIPERSSEEIDSRISELEGNTKQAEGILRRMAENSKEKSIPYDLMGGLKLRQGEWDAAVKSYEMALKVTPDKINAQRQLALAMWAAGRRDEALKLAMETMTGSQGNVLGFVPFVDMALAARTLTDGGVGNKVDREKANALAKVQLDYSVPNRYSLEAAGAVLAGKAPIEKTVRQIQDVLKAEPYLDWALWSALYVGLAKPAEAGDLLKPLPKGSVQARIAEVEKNAGAASQPTSSAAGCHASAPLPARRSRPLAKPGRLRKHVLLIQRDSL